MRPLRLVGKRYGVRQDRSRRGGARQLPCSPSSAHNRDLCRTALLRLSPNPSRWFRKQCGVTGGLSSYRVPRCFNHGAHTRGPDSKMRWWPTNRLPNCIEEGPGVSANDTPVAATKPEGDTAIPSSRFLFLSPKYVAKHKRLSSGSKAATNPSPLPPP